MNKMTFFEISERLKKKQAALIIYCILDRIPIIVFGQDQENINNILIELSDLVHFRREFVFHTDFMLKEEYDNLIQNEEEDFNIKRMIIRSPCDVTIKAFNMFDNFNGWILGMIIPKIDKEYNHILDSIQTKMKVFLAISLGPFSISLDLLGNDKKSLNLTFEREILQKVNQDTDNSISRMKRVLSDKIKIQKLDEDLMDMVLNFQAEKSEIKKNIFNTEVQNFYMGSKRAFFILSRLGLLSNLNISANIGSKTLLSTIDYDQVSNIKIISAPLERILSFIKKEWGEDFSNLVQIDKKIDLGNKIQSLWG